MIVYKCDACGKEIETDINVNIYRMSIGVVNILYDKVTSGIERDLCGKCYDKIIYILRGTDKNDNKEE